MIQPNSILPFYGILKRNRYKILDNQDKEIVGDLKSSVQDRDFIVHACNNYHKLVEQLRECEEALKTSDEYYQHKTYINTQKLLKELNEL